MSKHFAFSFAARRTFSLLSIMILALLVISLAACSGNGNGGPTAEIADGIPAATSATAAFSITVGGSDIVAYRYNIDDANGGAFGEATDVTTPISGTLADGTHTLKIIGGTAQGEWQSTAEATLVTWTIATPGYDYARLVGNVWTSSSEGQLKEGQDIAVDADGNSYVVDRENNRIQKFAADGSFVKTWGSFGSDDTNFKYPSGITLDGTFLYVGDYSNNRIVKYNYDGVFQTAWTTGTNTYPNGLAYSGGTLYATLRGNHTVIGYDTSGAIVYPAKTITGSPEAIGVDPSGSVYVGSDYGRVYKLPTELSTVSEFYNSNYVPVGIATDSDGNLYVSLQNLNTVEKVSPTGVKIDTFGSGWLSVPGSFMGPKGLAVAGSSLYVAEINRVQKLTLSGVSELIYANLSDNDGALLYPQGLTLDSSGNIYVADTNNHRIQKFANDGTFLSKWGIQGSSDGEFNSPYGLTFDATDNLYVTDNRNDRVQKFTSAGTYLGQWGANGTDDGELDGPTGIVADTGGNIFVADSLNDRIQVFSNEGTFVRKWGSYGTAEDQMIEPDGIALDPDGNAYIVQIETFFVQKFSATGEWLLSWAGTEGPGNNQLSYPYGIARDFGGNLFVADRNNHRVQKFASDGTYLMTIGTGVRGSGDGEFNGPTGVWIDTAGTLYVVDQGNNRIQVFSPQ